MSPSPFDPRPVVERGRNGIRYRVVTDGVAEGGTVRPFADNERFGADRQDMTAGTALHVLAYTFGVGTTWTWEAMCSNGTYRGGAATALVRTWDGPDAVIDGDRRHFWTHNSNFSSEVSEHALERNVLVVHAMREDGVRTG